MARVCLVEDLVVLSVVRPIHGLDMDEVLDAIRTVMVVADQLDGPLQNAYEVLMPQIDLDGETWQGVLDVFRLCDEHARLIFKQLLEGWVALDGTVTANRSGIGLCAIAGGDRTLAALSGYSQAGAQVTVGWDSLGRQWGLQEEDEAAFKGAMPRPERFRVTASLAHLPVDESFSEEMATQLLDALIGLDRALTRATPPPKPPLPDLEERWGLAIRVGAATRRGVHALLGACPPAVRDVYRVLIQGWHDAGLQLYTHTPDRVALRLTVDGHTFGLCTLYGPHELHGPRIELYYPLIYYFEKRDEARWRYEGAVARISQFRPHLSGGRILVDESFTEASAGALLKILCRLAEDVEAVG
jgi:hypothetical protein